ncbi:Retrovirus-related Pol polyprotein from type-1 retrotransposable element R2, partial [Durusdinium trenchii]
MGSTNPSGLSRRVSEVMQLPPGIWSFSETQLTEQGFRSFASQARHLAKEQGRQLRIHSGAAAPPRFLGSAAGAWTGVLTMSDFPQQLVHPQWKGAEFESGRLLMNTVHIGGLTLTGSTLYGPANSPTWKQPLSLLSELIDTVTEEIVLGRSGLRYVAGDFNCDRMQLPQFHEWYRRGWRELQQVAYDRWQQPFQPTCKASTQRDFFWASPELLQRLQQVEVWHDLFPDHSVVVGHFDLARSLEPLYYWPMPGTFWLDDEQIEVEQSKQVDFPAQQGWVTIHSDRLIVPGQTVEQHVVLDTPQKVQNELADLWAGRWNVMASLPDGAWNRIFAFARDYTATLPLRFERFTAEHIVSTLKKGSGLKTRGPDAWSRDDLLALPNEFRLDLANLFTAVESGADWPQQLCRGHVTCIAKVAQATEATQYRPITLFSLLYRIWGSCRARELLAQLEPFANFDTFGYIKHRSCVDLTYAIMVQVEIALLQGLSCNGVMVDIIRCFNHLPRKPIFLLGRKMGLPMPILVAWDNFLRNTRRSFRVQGMIGREVPSDSGFPEGDSMSCLAMIVALFSFHRYFQVFEPTISAYSYVDNLELVSSEVMHLVRGHLTLQAWTEMMTLHLDQSKTLAWAAQAADRRLLQLAGFAITEGTKDLGASMCYGSRHRRTSVTLRALIMQQLLVPETHFLMLSKLCFRVPKKVPCCALAAWACVHEDSGQTLASGLLPGLRLHNNRAELFAVYVAVLWSKHFFCDVDIFTDSSYVVRGWDALLRTRHVSFDCTNSDLWELLWQAMLVHENTVRLYKTEAHLDQTLLTDANSAWQAHWNSVADLSAKTARRTAGCARLRQVHERLIRTYEWHRHWALRYQAFLLSLAQRSMSTSTTESMHDDDSALNLFNWCSQNPGDLFDELPLDLASLISQSVKLRDFGLPIALKLATWLSRLDTAATLVLETTYGGKILLVGGLVGSFNAALLCRALRVGDLSE